MENPLLNSRPIDVHRWSDYPEVKDAAEKLYSELNFNHKSYRNCIRMLLMDLYQAWLVDPTQYVAYSRKKNKYFGNTRYNKLKINFFALTKTVDAMVTAGYIAHHKGGYFKNEITGEYYGWMSRMRATPMLLRLIEDKAITPKMVSRCDDEEVILLRAKPVIEMKGKKKVKVKYPVDYTSNPSYIDTMRRRVKDYNALLAKTYIDVDDEHLTNQELSKLREYKLDLTRKRVCRIFNNNSWLQGGRYYGSWWMECPKILRKFIRINGDPTVELDYSGVHVHLLYALEGINYAEQKEDAYTLEGFPNRAANKYVFLIALNAATEEDCISGVWNKVRRDNDTYQIRNQQQIKDILQALKTKHNPIAYRITEGYGVKLQNIDSQIAARVVNYFTARNIPILTVHDSFICTVFDEMVLLDQMKQAYVDIIRNLIEFEYTCTTEELFYDRDAVEVEIQNDELIDIDRKTLDPMRIIRDKKVLGTFSMGRRLLHYRDTGDTDTLVRLRSMHTISRNIIRS